MDSPEPIAWIGPIALRDLEKGKDPVVSCTFSEDSPIPMYLENPQIPDGDWLWSKLMDWCKRRGVSPANYSDLFNIVSEAREAK